jgi:hypothetical protein
MNGVRRQWRRACEWPALLEEWSRSGESAARFSARIGVKPSTLLRWRKSEAGKSRSMAHERKRTSGSSSLFARVQVVEPPSPDSGLIEVVLRGGAVVRIHGEVNAGALGAVLGALSRC